MPTINSPQIISKNTAVQFLDANVKPVMFWDTCSLLDIIRLPIPERRQSLHRLEKVMAIRQKIVSEDIISIASLLTVKEFNDHIINTRGEVIRSAQRITNDFNNFLRFVQKVNPAITHPSVNLNSFYLEDLLGDIVQDIAFFTKFIDRDDSFLRSAEHRVIMKIPPAKKKGEFKDCYIWSTCLEVRQSSVKAGVPFGFFSSNVKDYSELPKINFDPQIAVEATAANIEYYPNIDIAFGRLKASGVL